MIALVLGMHRSGTSALARLLNLAGLAFGPPEAAMPADVDNPRGFWERQDVYELHEWVLGKAGAAWDRPLEFDPDRLPPGIRDEFLARAARIADTFSRHRPWFIKDPRLSLTLPLWRRILARPVCVHILRHPLEVAASLAARNGMPLDVGLALWELHLVRARRAAWSLPWVGVRHHDLMTDPVGTLADVVEALTTHGMADVKMPLAHDVTSFITTDLHRHHWHRADLADWTDCPQARLFTAIDESASDGTAIPLSLSDEATAVLNRHAAAQRSSGGVIDSRNFAQA